MTHPVNRSDTPNNLISLCEATEVETESDEKSNIESTTIIEEHQNRNIDDNQSEIKPKEVVKSKILESEGTNKFIETSEEKSISLETNKMDQLKPKLQNNRDIFKNSKREFQNELYEGPESEVNSNHYNPIYVNQEKETKLPKNYRNHSNLCNDNKKLTQGENIKQKGKDNKLNKHKSNNNNQRNKLDHKASYDGNSEIKGDSKPFRKQAPKPPRNNYETPKKMERSINGIKKKEFKFIPNGKRNNSEINNNSASENKFTYSKGTYNSFKVDANGNGFNLNDLQEQKSEITQPTEEKQKLIDEGLNIKSAPYVPKECFEQKTKWFNPSEIFTFENYLNPEHEKLLNYAEAQIQNGNKKGKYDFPKPSALAYSGQK